MTWVPDEKNPCFKCVCKNGEPFCQFEQGCETEFGKILPAPPFDETFFRSYGAVLCLSSFCSSRVS